MLICKILIKSYKNNNCLIKEDGKLKPKHLNNIHTNIMLIFYLYYLFMQNIDGFADIILKKFKKIQK